MDEIKLKPCPFCGQVAQVLSQYDGIGWQVGCNNTLCPMCPHVSIWDKGYAITEWNTRATDPLVEQLAKALLTAETFIAEEEENRTSSFAIPQEDGTFDVSRLGEYESKYLHDARHSLSCVRAALAAYRAQHPEATK